jgi:hypothetical protein
VLSCAVTLRVPIGIYTPRENEDQEYFLGVKAAGA